MIVRSGIMIEVKFRIFKDEEYLCASGLTHDIFTQGKTWDDLMKNILEAIECHFEDSVKGQIKVTTEYQVNLSAETSGC